MTLASPGEAINEMLKMIRSVYSDRLGMPGKPLDVKTIGAQVEWARVSFETSTVGQASLANVEGARRWQTNGVLMIECFYPFGDTGAAYDFAQQFADVFEGKESPSGIWFRNVGVFESKDKASGWFRLDVLADYEYDRIK